MITNRKTLIATMAMAVCLSVGVAGEFVPFGEFLASARMDERCDAEPRLGEMCAHLFKMYEGAEATHTFFVDTDHYDCIPRMQQPSVRLLGITELATPPPPPVSPFTGHSVPSIPTAATATQLSSEDRDAFGNRLSCEPGTIPMRRLTLDRMSRFESLASFFGKSPVPVEQHKVCFFKQESFFLCSKQILIFLSFL